MKKSITVKKLAPKTNSAYKTNLEIRDSYVVPKDYIWKDCILRERSSRKSWRKTWASILEPIHSLQLNSIAFDGLKVNAKLKVGELEHSEKKEPINWSIKRSYDTGDNHPYPSLSNIQINNCKAHDSPPKIRFVNEQYGHYRKQKYLQDLKEKKLSTILNENLPTSKIIHHVNPLLC